MATAIPDWRRLVNHVMAVPERVYETWSTAVGWDNHTQWGVEYGWDGVAWCMEWDWDMFHAVGLDKLVPKTASVAAMWQWAKDHGLDTQYPSVGALVNFGAGSHTEIVTGFNKTTVFTKGGNSVKTGATDNGQGNGVWSHQHPRQSSYITGYLAPKFTDGCPPTADPNDRRGGKAVASWSWSPQLAEPSFPGRQCFVLGASNAYALELQTWLQRGGWGPAYKVGPSRTMTALDLDKVRALQQHYLADLGPADGLTGPKTWQYAYEVAHGLRKK